MALSKRNKLMRRMLFVMLAALLALPAGLPLRPGPAAAAEVAPGYAFERLAPQHAYTFKSIMDVDTDNEGHVYAADYTNRQIVKLDANGTILAVWQGDDGFSPQAVAAGVTGIVYASTGSTVAMIDTAGASPLPLQTWGNEQFGYITGLAFDSARGVLYAADESENAVWLVGEDGSVTAWTTYIDASDAAVPFESPSAVAVGDSGNVYVVEDGSRIVKLTPQGTFIRDYSTADSHSIAAIDVDAQGTIYTTDNDRNVAMRWDGNGVTSTPGGTGVRSLQFDSPYGIAVDGSGNVYVADTFHYRVQKLDAELRHVATWGSLGGEAGQFYYPEGVAIGPDGAVYVADSGNNRVQKFDSQLAYIEERGNPDDPESFVPYGVASDSFGNLYITGYSELYKYNSTDGTTALVAGGFGEPRAVAVDDAGNLYVADTGGHLVVKLLPDGDSLTWEGEPDAGSFYFRPQGIAVDSGRNIAYVSDSTHIQTFTLDGDPLEAAWGQPETGAFSYISGIALDGAGNVYVADSGANRISKFAPDGSRLASWGERGTGDEQSDDIRGIAVDGAGNVYVADSSSHRIQKFAYDGHHLGALAVAGGTLDRSFDPLATDYAVSMASSEAQLVLTPEARHADATIRVNGEPVDSGAASEAIPVAAGGTATVSVEVTAADGQARTYTLVATRAAIQNPDDGSGAGGPTGGDGPGGEGGVMPTPQASPSPTATPGPSSGGQEEVRVGTGSNTVNVTITRKRSADGRKTDVVSLDDQSVLAFARAAAGTGNKTARIVIDDLPQEPADAIVVGLSRKAVGTLDDYGLSLEIQTPDALISLSAETLALLKGDARDVTFTVVPARAPEELAATAARVLQAPEVKGAMPGGMAEVIGTPVQIEADYADRTTRLVFPLDRVRLPSDPVQLERLLESLAVYVEHSDGRHVLQRGTIVYDESGKPSGYEIAVYHFSAFTMLDLHDAVVYERYVSGDDDGLFHPERTLAQAELAALLARNLPAVAAAAADGAFPDVPAGHWAAASIALVRAEGLMVGDPSGSFRPDAAVTRAELATIAAAWAKLAPGETASPFADAAGHWASAAIAAVQREGWMVGYEDGTFRPDRPLTRAEGVAVLNRLLHRPAWDEATPANATWGDVPASHWAFAAIETASHTFVKRP
ncbi:MAG: S-layer homology domain-containing protein [Paenibacillaceae bacterium]|nr:S-layer homology domain-containing protein [Paenibacillaceae bacterium]